MAEQKTLSEVFEQASGKIKFESEKQKREFYESSVVACGCCNSSLRHKTNGINYFDGEEDKENVEAEYLFNCTNPSCEDKTTVKIMVIKDKVKTGEKNGYDVYEVENVTIKAKQTCGNKKVNIVSKDDVKLQK